MRKAIIINLLSASCVWAFPPAPHYTVYGMVRDQVGQVLRVEGAEIVLLKGMEEVGRTPVNSEVRLDQNYELNIRLDQNRSGTVIYSEKAVASQGAFSLYVEMNGEKFYPIEVSGNLHAGMGGERVRLDLNLGEDRDRDGLPDVWEEWQLYQAGYQTDAQGRWPLHLITPLGDLDKDGQTDRQEYIAGTFAGDATETFGLEIKEKLPQDVRLEFYAITGKTYTIERSSDLQKWSAVPFAVGVNGAGATSYRATEVGVRSVFTPAAQTGVTAHSFYRLTVR